MCKHVCTLCVHLCVYHWSYQWVSVVSVRQRYHRQVSSVTQICYHTMPPGVSLTITAGVKYLGQEWVKLAPGGTYLAFFSDRNQYLFPGGLFKISFLFILMNGQLIFGKSPSQNIGNWSGKNPDFVPFGFSLPHYWPNSDIREWQV